MGKGEGGGLVNQRCICDKEIRFFLKILFVALSHGKKDCSVCCTESLRQTIVLFIAL